MEPALVTPATVVVLLAVVALVAVSWLAGRASERARAHALPAVPRTEAAPVADDVAKAAADAPSDDAPEVSEGAHAQDAFLATLSHELRTPLTSIVAWANLLQLGHLGPEETARALDTILRNATAQNQLIDELLDVSRIARGKLVLDLRHVDLGAVVKGAVETVTPAASGKGIRLQLVLDPAGSWIAGDPERLQQVFWNLLFNAVTFTPRNGRVRVGVHSIGANVEVVVDDTGVGIEPGFLPRMFERFTQGDSSSTRAVRGLGLGLSLARQLAELHGGTIRAESAGLGYGSTFTATFPRSSATGATPWAEPEHEAHAGSSASIEDRLHALRAGFQLHLEKPVQPSQLVAAVASLAARHG